MTRSTTFVLQPLARFGESSAQGIHTEVYSLDDVIDAAGRAARDGFSHVYLYGPKAPRKFLTFVRLCRPEFDFILARARHTFVLTETNVPDSN